MRGGSQPRFSILLPTHNRADVLPFAIRSVLAQTESDFELLIVGDGCTDSTAGVVSELTDHRIRWFDLPKAPGFGYANRNVALREATGRYVAFMAHDDLWLHDHLGRLFSCLEENQADLAYSRPLWVAPDGTIAPAAFNLNDPDTFRLFHRRQVNMIAASTVVHRRECFDRAGMWNESLSSNADWDLWLRILQDHGPPCYLPVPTCLHFKAIWRTDANAAPPEIRHGWSLLGGSDWLPPALNLEVPAACSEQETFWNEMSGAPEAWARRLRAAVDQVLDRRLAESDRLLAGAFGQLESQQRAIHDLEARNRRLQAELAAHYSGDQGPILEGESDAPSLFFCGFHPDEGGWRWMAREGLIVLPPDGSPRELGFTLTCSRADNYDRFPFELRIFRESELERTVIFETGEQSDRLMLRVPPHRQPVRYRLESATSYVPALTGASEDGRLLSVRLSDVEVR